MPRYCTVYAHKACDSQDVLLYVPNIVGYVRLALLAIAVAVGRQQYYIAFYLLVTNFALDAVDGILARALHQVCSTLTFWNPCRPTPCFDKPQTCRCRPVAKRLLKTACSSAPAKSMCHIAGISIWCLARCCGRQYLQGCCMVLGCGRAIGGHSHSCRVPHICINPEGILSPTRGAAPYKMQA